MASRAKLLFDRIVGDSDAVATIEKMVADHWPETEYLDFKTAGAEGDNRKNWSIALSGFGNTEGGVIVWGVEAKGTPSPDGSGRKIDTAIQCKLVRHPLTFGQLLKDTQLQAVIEPLRGVEIKAWESTPGEGYVVCYVPEGEYKPYRADLEPSHQYWQRIGDKFVVLPHSLLRSLFYPRSHPILRMSVRRVAGFSPYICTVYNDGAATAEMIRFRFFFDAGLVYTDDANEQPPRGYRESASALGPLTLHPGELHGGVFRFGLRQSAQVSNETTVVYVSVHMRDQSPQYFRLALSESSLKVDERMPFEAAGATEFPARG